MAYYVELHKGKTINRLMAYYVDESYWLINMSMWIQIPTFGYFCYTISTMYVDHFF